ncbi:hypothetical protein HanLR1_Chr02g0051401 [Helianthus annuus]|nr:hypothetical protein HanHA89_Chr02g0053811 [Helianthus annuus]KAJ0776933.1 hypothetical protein HanLR1_Chr02g0051401 [Helianthus annuus]
MSQKYPHRVMTQYRHLWSPTSNHETPPRHTLFKPFRNPPVIRGHVGIRGCGFWNRCWCSSWLVGGGVCVDVVE